MAVTSLPADDADSLCRAAAAHLHRNDLRDAEALLSRALAIAPDNAETFRWAGILRRRQERLQEAEALYRRSLDLNPDDPETHHNLGNLLRDIARFDESIAEQRAAIGLKANLAHCHLALALALSAKGEHASAEASCREALRLQPNDLGSKLALAAELCALNRPRDAERLLRHSLAIGIRDPKLAAAFEYNLAIALKQQRRFAEALVLFDSAQRRDQRLAAADYGRGSTLQQLGRLDEAAQALRKCIESQPDHVDALATLALISAQLGDLISARNCAGRALALDGKHAVAQIVMAIAEAMDGSFSPALERIRGALAAGPGQHGAFALGFAADAFDRKGRTDEAFAIYAESNRLKREFASAEFAPVRAMNDVQRLTGHFRTAARWEPSSTPPHEAAGPARHVFILGFMRSGTTLLETVLATDPEVVHIDEVEFLTEASREFLLSEAGLDSLRNLGDGEASKWRHQYWEAIRKAAHPIDGKTFVDKMPFNALRLPLLSRLFPRARVVFTIRDPRDVVFSCFRRRFNPSPYAYEFLSLEDCARFYATVMELVGHYRRTLPLDILDHRYEDMVEDFDGSLRRVCTHTGLSWNETMRDFRSSAREIDDRSPSAAQVRRGLFTDGMGQWRRYREHLAPVLPILAPWVARFGYPAE